MLKFISTLVIVAVMLFGGTPRLFAQKYPDRPITLVIPMTPGDALDIAGRLIGEELSKLLKVPIVPLNKPGATGTIGTDMVVKAKKDGYTILMANNPSIVHTKITQPETVPYDSFKDLIPLGLSTVLPILIAVRSDAPYKDFNEMMGYAKKNPGNIRCGTPGVGSVGDFNVGIINMFAGVDMTSVPFKGASPAVTALLGGHIEAGFIGITPLIPHIRSGKLKGILVSKILPEFPDIPTLKQLGYKQDLCGGWHAFFAPAGVTAQITETLIPAIEKAVRDPIIYSKLVDLGMYLEYLPPDKLLAKMQEEYKILEEVAKQFGTKR